MVKKVATTATVIMVMFWTMIGVPMSVFAVDAASEACDSIKLLDSSAGCDDPAVAEKGFTKIIRVIINTLSVVVGAISVIVIIVGGFRYVTSGGDSNATKGAKDTIMYAVIGLVVVLFAQVIVRFVITQTNTPAPTSSSTSSSSSTSGTGSSSSSTSGSSGGN